MPDRFLNRVQNIRKRVLWPLGLTLTFFLLLFLAVFQIYLQRELTRELDGHINSVWHLYEEILSERADDMTSFIGAIEGNEPLRQAMALQDREALLEHAGPIYRKLQKNQPFTHFYFHAPNGINLLRVHKPETHGDLIDRVTMKQARSALQVSSGAELGPLGTFTLRTVFPWFVNGKLIGFIELGEEVEPLIEMVARQSGSQMAILVSKNRLTRSGWQSGQEMLGRAADWELLPGHVVTAVTDSQFLQKLPRIVTPETVSGEKRVDINLFNQHFRGGFLPLIDVSGQEIGVMLVVRDIDATMQNHGVATALVTVFCILLGGALFLSAYSILGRTEHTLERARQTLIDEIEKTSQANTQLGLEIGERRAAEEALRKAHDELERRVVERTAQLDQQKKLLENLLTNIPSLVAWKNLDREYIGCNSRYAALAGSSEEEIAGKTDGDLAWRPSLRRHLAAIEEEVLAENRAVLGYEVVDESPDGNDYYICSAVPLRDEAGAVFGMVSIMQNITEQKERQRLLETTLVESRQASDRIAGVMRSVDDALFVVDADDNILLMNASAGALLRLNPNEVIGRPVAKAIWVESLREKVIEILRRREGGAVFDFEIGEDGKEAQVILQAHSSVLVDPQGRYEGMIFLARDVTRDRSMDRLKSDFISVAAHELRTPLATILGFSELLLDGNVESEEDRRDFVRTIHDKADALSRLLDDMLDISRIESGRGLELFIEKIPVESLFLPVLNQYRKRFPERRFDIDLDDPELLLLADPEKIAQVLENLLSNAVKYSPEKSRIAIVGKTTVDGYRLSVIDEGIGMTPEQASHAFEKFYRGDNADKAIKGTGLGLTIARHIVEQHDGTIRLESRPQKGTCVHVLLPVA